MTQHWIDIRNADVVMIIGSNAAENHPMSFKWVQKAIDNGGTFISVDPRFTRSSSKADIYARMRSGTDIAFIGGIINYAITNNKYNQKYVEECTNALFKINTAFETCAEGDFGVFSGLTGGNDDVIGHLHDATYNRDTWAYQGSGSDPFVPDLATDLSDPHCVFQLLKKQFAGYTKAAVCAITGTDPDVYQEICETYCATGPDDKSATIMYAMGTTQHTVGTQNVRSYAMLQLLLGNMGVAGGGINALRGQDNVQGSTDMCILEHILPGYIKCPTGIDPDMTTFIKNWGARKESIIEPVHDYTCTYDGVTHEHQDPASKSWWQNGEKYMASLIKAWWPTQDLVQGYKHLPKKVKGKNYSMLSIFDAMYHGHIKGFICDGENPAVSDPDSNHVRAALAKLDWMVVIDPYETETATFWKRPGVTSGDIDTEVYLLPAAVAYERAGSRSNSGRWAQWHWKACDPPGDAKDDLEIITLLGQKIQDLYNTIPGGACPAVIKDLNWPYFDSTGTDDAQTRAEKCAKEVNGYNMNGAIPTTLVASFGGLANDGTTCSGNWLYCNQFVETVNLDQFEKNNPDMFAASPGNRMARRHAADVPNGGPSGDPSYPNIGLHSYWSWCWPVNRRIIYNRAGTYQSDGLNSNSGDPLAPNKYVIRWNDGSPKGSFKGDVPDGGWAPGDAYPLIMHKEGHAHLFGSGRVDGPFPWHYEPVESAVTNPMGNYQVNPIIHIYDGAAFGDKDTYPIAATTYRLTEHWHTGSMTRNLPWCNELQPEPFVEMSEELADIKEISNGNMVTVSCARGSIEVKACVTKRFKPFQLNGQTLHQVGIIWHWGYATLNPGPSGNILTPFVGDANTRIQESKAFLVDITKVA